MKTKLILLILIFATIDIFSAFFTNPEINKHDEYFGMPDTYNPEIVYPGVMQDEHRYYHPLWDDHSWMLVVHQRFFNNIVTEDSNYWLCKEKIYFMFCSVRSPLGCETRFYIVEENAGMTSDDCFERMKKSGGTFSIIY